METGRRSKLAANLHADKVVAPLTMAMRLDPQYHDIFLRSPGQAHFMAGAVAVRARRLKRRPDSDPKRARLAVSYGHLGRNREARAQWAEMLRINPDYSLENKRDVLRSRDPADFEKIVEGVRKAGLLPPPG